MLTRLFIKNFAIIDELEVRFPQGLNVITGETGAGKSIVMGALQLILGQRVDSTALHPEKKCIVEGIFNTGLSEGIEEFIRNNDLDNSEEWVLRREITAAGKSRSFINDSPVTLSQLKAMATLLVDLHQQFDTHELAEEDFQKQVLDSLAGNTKFIRSLGEKFDKYSVCRKKLEAMRSEQDRAARELDYHRFLYEELFGLGLKENELEDLEAENKLLNSSESIKENLLAVNHQLSGKEEPVIQKIRLLQNKLGEVAALLPAADELLKRLQSCLLELMDIDDEVGRLEQSVGFDAQRIQFINDRLSEGYRLLKKHGLQQTNQLIKLRDELEAKINLVQEMGSEIDQLEKEVSVLKQDAMELATKISANRQKQIKPFISKVNELLHRVGMPHAGIQVDMKICEVNRSGIDAVEFLFQANLSKRGEAQAFQPLGKVASGGELSRLMLCIKSLVAEGLHMPTLIFDEIDSGISGEAAKQVAAIMKELSVSHQLIAITHQPQIAARADTHYFVYKEMKDEKIVSRLRQLDNEGRITAIARMLGGEKPTAAAMANAREMVEHP